jgi:hypothetical protein
MTCHYLVDKAFLLVKKLWTRRWRDISPPTFSLWDLVACLCKMLPVGCLVDEAATSSSFYSLLVEQD